MSDLNIAVVGIGSNISPEENIHRALEFLGEKSKIVKVSSFLKTKPIGIEDQPDFTNGAVKIETELERDELTTSLKEIENRLGRDRTAPKFGPRTIDLDIMVWNGQVVDDDYYSRDFLRRSVKEVL